MRRKEEKQRRFLAFNCVQPLTSRKQDIEWNSEKIANFNGKHDIFNNFELKAVSICIFTLQSKPIYSTLVRWILDGTLEDPHGEFFVASDPQVTDEARLWFDKYSIRKSMIPKFLSLSWVKKILATGKSINFLR